MTDRRKGRARHIVCVHVFDEAQQRVEEFLYCCVPFLTRYTGNNLVFAMW